MPTFEFHVISTYSKTSSIFKLSSQLFKNVKTMFTGHLKAGGGPGFGPWVVC
jgi:hypothetical protein